MNVRPSVCQIVISRHGGQREVGVVEDRWARVDPDPGQQADDRVEQACRRSPMRPRPTSRPSTRRSCGRCHPPRAAGTRAPRVRGRAAIPAGTVMIANATVVFRLFEELRRRQHVLVLVEADPRLRQTGERRRAVEAEVEVAEERIEDEDREDQQRRQQQQVGELHPLRAPPRGPHGSIRSSVRARRTRAAGAGAAESCTAAPSPGTASSDGDAHDHHLAVVEPADHVPFVAERLDHGDGGRERAAVALERRRSRGARVARRARQRSHPRRAPRRRAAQGAGPALPATVTRVADDLPVTVFIGGLPMNRATNRLAGRSYTSCGGPTCWSRPSFMIAMRSPIVIASTWSWVTYTNVAASRRCSSMSSARVCTRSLASRFESGSSMRNAVGRRTIARASATRWR